MKDANGHVLWPGALIMVPHADPVKRRDYYKGPIKLEGGIIEVAAARRALKEKTGFDASEIIETTRGLYVPARHVVLLRDHGLTPADKPFIQILSDLL